MNESLESIMEVREDTMVSPVGDSEPTFRTAHFLQPVADGSVSEVLSSSAHVPPMFEPKEWPLVIHFSGWHYPKMKWCEWVDTLQLRYESVWKKVGIFEAIMSTKCYITKNQYLIFGVSEKWCSKTNTFLFPWGEATITLEDVMMLGGYPVVGDPVFMPLQNEEMREVAKKLVHARKEPWRRKQRKANGTAWMDLFGNSGNEIEHEAFLAFWLSMFVFSHKSYMNNVVFPIAIHLARGNSIALAPAVLASIYKDLGLLKKTIVGFTRNQVAFELEVTLQSPFYLVQIWVWERFRNLQPQPNLINKEDPILFRWHKVKALKTDNVRTELDSATEDFLWRPYVKLVGKCRVFYPKNETWVPCETDLDKELVSFFTCLRFSELVGVDSIVKQYLPHRVSMQFGMDQDVPGYVPRFNATKAVAWENYCRPISDRDLYFPSRLFEADVTTRYARWLKQSVLSPSDFSKNIVRRKRSARSSNHWHHISKARKSGNDADVPPGFPPKLVSTVTFGRSCDDVSKGWKCENDAVVPDYFLHKCLEIVPFGNSVQDGLTDNENIDADVPTGFTPKHDTLTPSIAVENCRPVLEENKCGDMTHSSVKVCGNSPDQSSSYSTAVYGDVRRIFPLTKPAVKDTIEPSTGNLEEDFEDANRSKEPRLSSDRVSLSGTQGDMAPKLTLKQMKRLLEEKQAEQARLAAEAAQADKDNPEVIIIDDEETGREPRQQKVDATGQPSVIVDGGSSCGTAGNVSASLTSNYMGVLNDSPTEGGLSFLRPDQFLQHDIGPAGEKFPTTKFQDRFLLRPFDLKMNENLDEANACQVLATEGLRLASLMRWAELEAIKMKTALAEKDTALAKMEARISELLNQEGVEILKKKIADLEKVNQQTAEQAVKLKEEKEKAEKELSDLRASSEKVESELATLKKEKQEAEDFHKISMEEWISKENQLRDQPKAILVDAASSRQYKAGFLNAKAQAELFMPGVDLSGMDMFKVVRYGELVEEEEEDEEEEEEAA